MNRLAFAIALTLCLPGVASAADLYRGGDWAAMASDRRAADIGDSLTVLIYEDAAASNAAQSRTGKRRGFAGSVKATPATDEHADLDLSSDFQGGGQIGRSRRLIAQIGVVVDEVLPNGDLHVSGQQDVNIDEARTRIKLKGRVRPEDISSGNTVLSSRLADVSIDYDGRGYLTRSAKPGVVARVFSWLGLF